MAVYFGTEAIINPIQDGPFWDCPRIAEEAERPPPLLPKICYTCPEMSKPDTVTPYLKKIQNTC